MKKRIKAIVIFISIITILMLIYINIILNIDIFTLSYDGKIYEYSNKYYNNKSETFILDFIINDIYKDYNENINIYNGMDNNMNITEQDINTMKNFNIMKNIFEKYVGIEKEYYNQHIDNLIKKEELKKTNYYKCGEIIYIIEYDYEIAFTLDLKNIQYRNMEIGNYRWNENWQYKEITNKNKERVYKEIKDILDELEITKKYGFEPDTIYIKYYNGIIYEWNGEIYIIEDNKNNIKIEYELELGRINDIQIGFNNIERNN